MRKRNYSLCIRLTRQEHSSVKSRVQKSGLSMREFILHCVQNKEIIVKEGGLNVVVELKRIGNNLNQISRWANAGTIVDCTYELNQIANEMREVRKQWQS